MIRLGLRLTIKGGKEAAVRLVVTAAAVALGVGLLLIALSGMNALNAQNGRTAWLNTSTFGHGPDLGVHGPPAAATASVSDPLWWLFNTDHFANLTIDRVDVAATGAHSPVPPGLAHLPGAGQYYLSPALSRLMRSTPADQLADRFPGKQIGIIGPAALPAPNSLIIVIGHTAAQLSTTPGAGLVTSINTTTGQSGGPNGWDANKLQTILAVGALALLFPVLIFIGTATRLAAARREQRFAAMRLVGSTPRQVSVIATVEMSVAAVAGVVGGFGVFFLLRPVLTNVPFTGEPFAPGDLSLGPVAVLLVALGVPVAAAIAARLALRRVQISPLGVSRRVTPPAPRAYRLVPLVAGIAELAYFVGVGPPNSTGGQILAYFSGCLLMMAGLVIAGPWLTMMGSRVMTRRTGNPAVLIAGRRLSDNPRGAFRAISGLIIALFVTSVSVGVITTIIDYQGTSGGPVAGRTLVDSFQEGGAASGPTAALAPGLGSKAGIRGVTVVYSPRSDNQQGAGPPPNPDQQRVSPQPDLLVSCAQLALTPSLGRCQRGAAVATITANLDDSAVTGKSTLATSVWPAAAISPERLQSLPVQAIVVVTDGSSAALERTRTALEVAMPNGNPPATLGEISAQNQRQIAELKQMTSVVIIVSLIIAGCSLAVSVTSGVADRKRPFSLLRVTGVPLGVLRGVVALEAAVHLAVISVLSAGMGFLAAGLFLRSQLSESLQPPGLDYYVIVIGGLIASLGIIASTLPLIERITGPDVARSE